MNVWTVAGIVIALTVPPALLAIHLAHVKLREEQHAAMLDRLNNTEGDG